MKKKIAVSLILALALLLTACTGGGAVTRPEPDEGAELFEVEGECTAVVQDGVITVTGTCNIAEGTNGTLSVYSYDGRELAMEKVTQNAEGTLTAQFEIEEDWEGDAYAFLLFDTNQSDRQPSEITDIYGKRFQNITGAATLYNQYGVAAVFQSPLITISQS